MNTYFALLAFAAAIAYCSAQGAVDDVSGRFYGCDQNSKDAVDHDFNLFAKRYPNSNHVFYYLQLKSFSEMRSFSIDICWDAPHCITAAWNVYSYPYQSPYGGHCWSLVSMRDMAIEVGTMIAIRFEGYSRTPVQVSSITLHGNGVISQKMVPRYSPQSPSAYCTACDGDYFPDAGSCEHFYQCSNGVAYKMRCSAGLHYNTGLDVCDYPTNAGCFYSKAEGMRRIQCRGANNNCPTDVTPVQRTRLIQTCSHGNPEPTTAPPP